MNGRCFLVFAIICSTSSGGIWDIARPSIGQLGMDGDFVLQRKIGTIDNKTNIAFVLVHKQADRYDSPSSVLSVPQLTTYLLRTSDRGFRWLAPNGTTRRFNGKGICWSSSAGDSASWHLVTAQDGCTIRSSESNEVLRYIDGSIVEYRRDDAYVTIQAIDSQIIKIIEPGTSPRDLLIAQYDQFGRLTELKLTSEEFDFEYNGNGDQLSKIERKKIGRSLLWQFRYQTGLLSAFEDGHSLTQLTWRRNEGYGDKRRSNYRLLYSLRSVGNDDYDYCIGTLGVEAKWRKNGRGWSGITYNPLTGSVAEWQEKSK